MRQQRPQFLKPVMKENSKTTVHRKFLARLNQELSPRINAIMGLAKILEKRSGSDENVQQILKTTRDLADTIERELAEAIHGNVAAVTNADAPCDVLYIEDDRRSFAAVHLLLGNRRDLKVLQAKD